MQNAELALAASLEADDAREGSRGGQNAGAANAGTKNSRTAGERPPRWPGVVSLGAFVFSGVSLYMTVLMQAELSVHVGELGQLSWDKTGAEIIALPVTVMNHGARDAVVYGLRLGPEDAPDRDRSVLVGVPSAGQNEPFAPWPVAGHGSRSGVIQFQASRNVGPLMTPNMGASVRSYHLCLSVRAQVGDSFGFLDRLLEHPPAALRLVVEPELMFSASDMKYGSLIPLSVHDIETIDDCRTR